MYQINRLAILAMLIIASLPTLAAEAPPKPIELKVLDRLAGNWDTQFTNKVAPWTPAEFKSTGILKLDWVLNNRHLMGGGEDSSSNTFRLAWTYNAGVKKYQTDYFPSAGDPIHWQGDWIPEKDSFVVKYNLPNGMTSTMTLHIVGNDTVEWTANIKDNTGKIYQEMEGKWVRHK